jgi:hypothetical protein
MASTVERGSAAARTGLEAPEMRVSTWILPPPSPAAISSRGDMRGVDRWSALQHEWPGVSRHSSLRAGPREQGRDGARLCARRLPGQRRGAHGRGSPGGSVDLLLLAVGGGRGSGTTNTGAMTIFYQIPDLAADRTPVRFGRGHGRRPRPERGSNAPSRTPRPSARTKMPPADAPPPRAPESAPARPALRGLEVEALLPSAGRAPVLAAAARWARGGAREFSSPPPRR